MWHEISPVANQRGWIWAVGIVVVLAALNFLEVALWPS